MVHKTIISQVKPVEYYQAIIESERSPDQMFED